MIAIVESPLGDVAAATLVEVLQIGIEVRVPHGPQHGEEEGICVNHIDKVRVAAVEPIAWPAAHEARPGWIESCDACQWFLHIIGNHAGHVSSKTEANQMNLLTAVDACSKKIVDELRQALGHNGCVLYCPRVVAGPAH